MWMQNAGHNVIDEEKRCKFVTNLQYRVQAYDMSHFLCLRLKSSYCIVILMYWNIVYQYTDVILHDLRPVQLLFISCLLATDGNKVDKVGTYIYLVTGC